MLTKSDLKQISLIVTKENEITRKEFRKEFKNINKKLDKSIDFLDRDSFKLLKRVERIEKHLNLPPVTS